MAALDDRIVALEARLAALKQEREAKARAALQAARSRERKAEARRKFELGGLIKIADLFEVDKGALLGGLISLRPALENPNRFAEFKQVGDAMLAERERSRKGRSATPSTEPPNLTDEYLR